MKLIIISDINSRAKSIIPYGLRLAKKMNATVHIVHPVDTRMHQGVVSRVADSQSISPGNKLSHYSIIEREINTARNDINNLLSREASVLNYPLKINTHIEENSIRQSIQNILMDHNIEESYLILINALSDNYVFHSQSDLLETAKGLKSCTLLVPPGEEFHEIKKVLLLTDFEENNLESNNFRSLKPLVDKFDFIVEAVDVAKPKRLNESKLKIKKWEHMVLNSNLPFNKFKTKIVASNDYFWALKEIIKQSNPDFILPKKQTNGWFNGNINYKLSRKLIEYSHKVLLV